MQAEKQKIQRLWAGHVICVKEQHVRSPGNEDHSDALVDSGAN